ncbi:hypothetical protein [Parasitella parasitica]|uniref:Uncharacterized protein n=1 Tax=Parasitella parasitica TaxID=35722 RepID=A0A0B7NRI2_9FUNG|nr:hypothetical protein [Parasitella parasitica]
MTSIIGYTRVPFNPSCSIAPVQRLYQSRPPFSKAAADSTRNSSKSSNENGSRPTFHRMFSRESSGSNGIIELIGNHSKPSLQSSKIAIVTKPSMAKNARNKTSAAINHKNYNTHLSIDLGNKRDCDHLPTLTIDQATSCSSTTNYDNLQRLMDSIAKLAHDKSVKFLNIIELLKQLQMHQRQHRFLSCIDKQKDAIIIYFPNTIAKNVDQTYHWLKTHAGIDIKHYDADQWHLVQEVPEQKDFFDGPKYFEDIHMFISQVDALIESNGLFSHRKKGGENQ